MEVEHPESALQARHTPMLAKQITPPYTKKSFSTSAVFKQRPDKTKKKLEKAPQLAFHIPNPTGEDGPGGHKQAGKLPSSSHSPQKERHKRSRKRSNEHPIVVEFKETSDNYKRHLYSTATSEINKTLQRLLHQLHESTLQNVPPSNPDETSPLKLSKPAQYEHMATAIYRPLSAYRLGLTRINTEGEKTRVENTLADRMRNFDEHIQQQTQELKQLQTEWETIVGEIFKLGVICLGQGTMETLFSASENTLSPSKATDADIDDAESTLFVPEQDTPPQGKKNDGTFKVPFPPFLYQPSRFRKPTPEPPTLSDEKVKELEMQIDELGKEHLKELRKIEDVRTAWLKKKHRLIAQAMLKED